MKAATTADSSEEDEMAQFTQVEATKIGQVRFGDDVASVFRVFADGIEIGAAFPRHGDSLNCWLDDSIVKLVVDGAITVDQLEDAVGVL